MNRLTSFFFFILLAAHSITFSAQKCRNLGAHNVAIVTSDHNAFNGGRVRISRANGTTVSYMRTGRDFTYASQYYSPEVTTPEYLKGKDVLDAGTGHGVFIYQLSRLGYAKSAVGVDIHLDEQQKATPELFVEADMADMPFKAKKFDLIFSTWSVISYQMSDYPRQDFDLQLVQKVLIEFKRVLKMGGKIHISPINRITSLENTIQFVNIYLVPILNEIGGLELTRIYDPQNGHPDGFPPNALEITRIKETP